MEGLHFKATDRFILVWERKNENNRHKREGNASVCQWQSSQLVENEELAETDREKKGEATPSQKASERTGRIIA
jgi:hypothetical protein